MSFIITRTINQIMILVYEELYIGMTIILLSPCCKGYHVTLNIQKGNEIIQSELNVCCASIFLGIISMFFRIDIQ